MRGDAMQFERGLLKFCACGRNDLGQLGNSSRESWNEPRSLQQLEDIHVVDLEAGRNNTVAITVAGDVLVCGENDSGQIGAKHRNRQQTAPDFELVDLPVDSIVSSASCGSSHVIVVNSNGNLLSWGGSEYGQLGQKESKGGADIVPFPKQIKGVSTTRFVQVSCGANHTVALSSSGRVFTFGEGACGALGHGHRKNKSVPTPVSQLQGAAVVQVAAGENHSCALGIDGKVYTWGKGRHGQLGNGRFNSSLLPVHVSKLQEPAKYVSSGADHIFAISWNGVLYSWGRGSWGQTGLGTTENIATPSKVLGLGNERAIQVSSGDKHAVILTESNRVFAMGNGRHGQLGIGKSINFTAIPVEVKHLPAAHLVLKVVTGGDHTLFVMLPFDVAMPDRRGSLPDKATVCKRFHKLWHQKSLPCARIPSFSHLLADLHASNAKKLDHLVCSIEDIFSSPGFLVSGFRCQGSEGADENDCSSSHALDISCIQYVYASLLKEAEQHEMIGKVLLNAMKNCLLLIENNLISKGSKQHASGAHKQKCVDQLHYATFLRALLIIMQNPLFSNCNMRWKSALNCLQFHLVKIISNLPERFRLLLAEWMAQYPSNIFASQFVQPMQQFLSSHVQSNYDDTPGRQWNDVSKAAIQVLVTMHAANEAAGGLLPFHEFYNADLSHTVNLRDHYISWIQLGEHEAKHGPLVSLCQVPFIMTTEAKVRILQGESNLQKRNEMRNSHLLAVYEGRNDWTEFCELRITRENLVQDTIDQIICRTRDLKKPLKVVFTTAGVEEEGLDEGGITKEFFQLLVRQLLHADYGMFTYNQDSHTYWFSLGSPACDLEFQLVGILLGLAIYNGVILDIRFPKFLYKKLKGLKPDFADLQEAAPELAKQLQFILDFDGDVENTFSLFFATEYEYYGKMEQHELIPNGSNIPVTSDNRKHYVELYTNFMLEESISNQFSCFSSGFHQVCGGPALALFRPEELELLVCGQPNLDFVALQESTHYDGGYTASSRVVCAFWKLIQKMSLDQQKKFLFFVTGCNRAPVGGLGKLGFTIQRSGPDTDHLPTSHTCFNILLLPEYSSESKLEAKLRVALENAEGFGLQ